MTNLDVLAGIVGSDGHLSRGTDGKYSVQVINTNIEFLNSIVIPSIKKYSGKIPSTYFVPSGFGEGKYITILSSKMLWKVFVERYNIPPGAKSITIKPPKLSNLESRIDYLCGWIAGDGSVTHDRMRCKIEIWSKSEPMIMWFRKVLKELNIQTTLFRERNKKEFILRIGKKEQVMRFYYRVSLLHPGKQRKFDSLVEKWIS